MKKIKLITSIAALATVGTTVGVLASCNNNSNVKITGGYLDSSKSTIKKDKESTLYLTPNAGLEITGLKTVKVGGKALTGDQYTFSVIEVNAKSQGKLVIKKEAMTSTDIELVLKTAVETIDIVSIESASGPVGVTENDVIYADDFLVKVKFSDDTSGYVPLGKKCKAFVGSTDITDELNSKDGYKVAQSTDLTVTFKAGKEWEIAKDCTISVQPSATLQAIEVSEVKPTPVYTKGGAVKPSNFDVIAKYDKGADRKITSGYTVSVNGVEKPEFFTTGYILKDSSEQLTFTYMGKTAFITLYVVNVLASIDTSVAANVEIKTQYDANQRTVVIGPKDKIITPVTDIDSITKGATTLTRGSDYSWSVDESTGNYTISFSENAIKNLGQISIKPSIATITSLLVQPLSDFTTDSKLKWEHLSVIGNYDPTGTIPLSYKPAIGSGYAAYINTGTEEKEIDLTAGHVLKEGDNDIIIKLWTSPSTTHSSPTKTITIKATNVTADITKAESEYVKIKTPFSHTTHDVVIAPTTDTTDIDGIDEIKKGNSTLTAGTDYQLLEDSDGTWKITLIGNSMDIPGNLVIKPKTKAALYTINAQGLVAMTDACKAKAENITIPTTVRGVIVTGIQDNGCKEAKATGISFETATNIKTIGNSAFWKCTSLSSINLPNSVTTIGEMAFLNTAITNITIPSNISSIEGYVFAGCSQLSQVTFTNPKLTDIGTGAFQGCSSLTQIEIPSTVTTISSQSFYNAGLQSVTFATGSQLQFIGNGAFDECTNLTSIGTLPSSIKVISKNAFRNTNAELRSIAFNNPETDAWIQFGGTSYINIATASTNATNLKECRESVADNWGCTGIKKATLGTITVSKSENGHNIDYDNEKAYYTSYIELSDGTKPIKGATLVDNDYVTMTAVSGTDGRYQLTKKATTGQVSASKTSITITAPEYAPRTWDVVVASFSTLKFDNASDKGMITSYNSPKNTVYLPDQYYDEATSTWVDVTSIQSKAFNNIHSLYNIYLPAKLNKIEKQAFYNIYGLKETGTIVFGDQDKKWQQIDGSEQLTISNARQNAIELQTWDSEEKGTDGEWGKTGIEEMKGEFDLSSNESCHNLGQEYIFNIKDKDTGKAPTVTPTVTFSNPSIVSWSTTATPGAYMLSPILTAGIGQTVMTVSAEGYETAQFDIETGSYGVLSFTKGSKTVTKNVEKTGFNSLYIPSRWYDTTTKEWTNVENIAESAFANETALWQVYLPSTLKFIDKEAFGGCTALAAEGGKVIFADTTANWVQTGHVGTLSVATPRTNAINLTTTTGESATGSNWGKTGIWVDNTTNYTLTYDSQEDIYSIHTTEGEYDYVKLVKGVTYKFTINVLTYGVNVIAFNLKDKDGNYVAFEWHKSKSHIQGDLTKWEYTEEDDPGIYSTEPDTEILGAGISTFILTLPDGVDEVEVTAIAG